MTCDPARVTADSAWNLRVWQTDEGLPDNSVVGIAQTEEGFLWVATQGGLVRFDGLEFRQCAPVTAAGLPSGLMRVLCVDRQDRLWTAKDRGVLICKDDERVTAFTTQDGMPLIRAKTLAVDGEDNVWVAYDGRTVVRVQQGRLRSFTTSDGLPGSDACRLTGDRDGRLWYAGGDKVGCFQDGRFIERATVAGASALAATRAGGVWVCAGRTLYRCSELGQLTEVAELPASAATATPTVAFEDSSGAVWVGTSGAGLFRYGGSVVEGVSTSHRQISCLAEDREGSIWVGTLGGGLNRLRRSVVELQESLAGQPLPGARSVCQDTEGALWVVDREGRVLRAQGKGWQPISTNEGWTIPNAASIAAEPGGGVWIGTELNGLHLWRGKLITSLYRTDGLAGNIVRSLLVMPSGDLWVGTTGEELQKWRAGQFQTFRLPPGSGSVRAMTADASGTVWIGTGSGLLLRVKENELVNETRTSSAFPQAVRCLCATPDGSLWIGYGGAGLGRLKDGHFAQYGEAQGLHDEYISEILDDRHGRLWLAGNRGISCARVSDFDELALGRLGRVQPLVFGRGDGLPALQASWEFWPGALCARDDRLCIAMQTALVVLHPDLLRRNASPPRVVIDRVLVDRREVATYDPAALGTNPPALLRLRPPAGRLDLPARHRELAFSFTAPSFVSPNNEGFKYKLEEFDADWVDAGSRRVAYYNHIPPGKYVFRVIACSSLGLWNDVGASLEITAEPRLWETVWFRIAELIAGCGLLSSAVYLGARHRYRRRLELLEQRQALERERTRIAQDLHDDLGAGLVEISLGSELAQDANLTADEAREHTREIGTRARELVTALDEIVWAVNPRHDSVESLATYFCQYTQHFLRSARMRCHLEVPKDLPAAALNAEQRHNLFLAFKEALSNVVQHAGATDLRLAISVDQGVLVIAVGDNGRGFDSAALSAPVGADGLGNMRRRLRQAGGEYQLSTTLGKGTTVMFKVPLQGLSPNGTP